MLKEIKVKNFAIIEDLTLELGPGLSILSGETGAGKSIIIGALGIVLGERAYTEMIMTGKESAHVEALFEVNGLAAAKALGIDESAGLRLKRTVSRAGKTRAYVNDKPVSLQAMSAIGAALVDIHGQHEHQSILGRDHQLRLLDHFGGLASDRAKVAEAYSEVSRLRTRLEDLRLGTRERKGRK